MQKMMTQEIQKRTPRLYETDGTGGNAIIQAHYFCLHNGWDWYLTEYDPETQEAFGLVSGFASELGYFSLAEFEQINRKHGFEVIERDTHWEPLSIGDVQMREACNVF